MAALDRDRSGGGVTVISSLMAHGRVVPLPPPSTSKTADRYLIYQGWLPGYLGGQPTNTSTTSSTSMIIRMVLVWTVFSAVAAFDVFGANNQVTTNNWEPAGSRPEVSSAYWDIDLTGTTARQLVRGKQNTTGRGCEFLLWKLSLTSVYVSPRNI